MEHVKKADTKTDHMVRMLGVSHSRRLTDVYSKLLRRYPRIVQDLLEDLLKIDEYSEIEIAFGAGIPLDIVRKLSANRIDHVSREYFLSILELYARVFCQL